jgi:hypothetical protein
LVFQLHAQRVRERLHGMFRGRVGALQDEGAVRQDAADVDDGAAAPFQVLGGGQRAFHDAPVIDLEELTLVGDRHLLDGAVDRHRRVVDPGIETAEAVDRRFGDAPQIIGLRHVGHDRDRLAALGPDLPRELLERRFVAGDENQTGAALGGGARGGEADAA